MLEVFVMRFVLGGMLALALGAPVLSAQTALDLSIGVGRGLGVSNADDRTLLALDATVARVVRRVERGAIPVAISAHAAPAIQNGDCVALPGAVCRRNFPSLSSVALLSGWSRQADFSRGPRLLAGPAMVWNDDTSSKGVGFILRADYAESMGRHAAFVFGAQSVIAPRYLGARVATATVTAGVRLR